MLLPIHRRIIRVTILTEQLDSRKKKQEEGKISIRRRQNGVGGVKGKSVLEVPPTAAACPLPLS